MFQFASQSWLNLDCIWSLVLIFKRVAPVKPTTPRSIRSISGRLQVDTHEVHSEWPPAKICLLMMLGTIFGENNFRNQSLVTGLNVGLWYFFAFLHPYLANAGDICKHLNWRREQRRVKTGERSAFKAFQPKTNRYCLSILLKPHRWSLCLGGWARSQNIEPHWWAAPGMCVDLVQIPLWLHLAWPNKDLDRRQI